MTDIQPGKIHAAPTAAPRPIDLGEVWKSLAWRGFAGVLFGVITLVYPGLSLTALVLLFAAYTLVDGVINIANVVRKRTGNERWWALLLEGLVSIAAAAVTIVWPALTAIALVYVVAVWAIATGASEVVTAVRLRRAIRHEWLLGLAGLLSIAFGVLLMIAPGAGALALTLWLGAYALVFGALMIALGFRLHRAADHRLPSGPQIGVPA